MLNDNAWEAIPSGVKLSPEKIDHLRTWVKKHYRDSLSGNELQDPNFVDECHRALDELTQITDLGAIYPFQRDS